ncbi:MAG TPA: hypothetical protein PKL13_03770 [bacterium]|nr:hypothetical protein [bacterium]
MKNCVIIGITINGGVTNRRLENLEKQKSIIRGFVNNAIVASALLIQISSKKTKVQILKGKMEDFKEILDKECPDWEQDKNLINLVA